MEYILKIICWFYVLSAIEAARLGASCNNTVQCTQTIETCTSNVCECSIGYFNVSGECNLNRGIAPNITKITSTTTTISIYWSHPYIYYDLLSNYEVIWRMDGSSATESSGLLDKTVQQYIVSTYLMAGQLYIVNVISHADISKYSASNVVPSVDATVRLVPVHTATLLTRECDFTHNNLLLKWKPAPETFVTRYEIRIEGITYTTTNFFPMFQFNRKVFLPGWPYYVRIVTVSGTTDVKKSRQLRTWIRTNPTRPGPPTSVKCVVNPNDVSLEISWTPPTNPNGVIDHYQININPGKMNQVNVSSSSTKKKINNLNSEDTYTFAVRTVNDATESVRVSYPSHEVSCKITDEVETANTLQTTSTIVTPTTHVDSNETGLAPIITNVTSTTTSISVFWNHPSILFELVYNYEVTWKMTETSAVESSGLLDKTVTQYTVSSYLMAGQLYVVNVISHVKLTNISTSIAEQSKDATVRLVPVHTGSLLTRECNFAHDNLLLKWTPPFETFVTIYKVIIEGITYTTTNFFPMLQFNGKVFIPGWRYYVRIVTISGTTHVKKSRQFSTWIRTIPTKPGPPTNINCVVNQVDDSIEISWTPPTNPNGVIVQYQININPGKWDQKNISSDSTKKIIKNLLPEQTYTFTVRTVNDAVESIRVSGPSQAVSCQIKPNATDSTALPPVTETSSKTNTVSKTTSLPPFTSTPQIKDTVSKTTSLPRITSTPDTVSKATSMPPVTSTPQIKDTVSKATSMPPVTSTPQIKDTENCICKSSGSTIPTSKTTVLLFALVWIPSWIIQKIITDTA